MDFRFDLERQLENGAVHFAVAAGSLPFSLYKARYLNVLQLGDQLAAGLGTRVEKERRVLLMCAVALTASCVAAAGGIAFLGLIAPHLARRLIGPRHQTLIPVSALIGAFLFLLADTLAKCACTVRSSRRPGDFRARSAVFCIFADENEIEEGDCRDELIIGGTAYCRLWRPFDSERIGYRHPERKNYNADRSERLRKIDGSQNDVKNHETEIRRRLFKRTGDHAKSTKDIAKEMAILPQTPEAPSGLTVYELVSYGRFPHQSGMGRLSDKDRDMIKWALEETGMAEFYDRPIEALSGAAAACVDRHGARSRNGAAAS